MLTPFEIVSYLFGSAGVVLTLVSNVMKRMAPLRIFAVGASSCFLGHALMQHDLIMTALHVVLLSVNAYRLWDLQRLLTALESTKADTPLKDWLLPHMKKTKLKAGTILFSKGDMAHQLFYVRKGTIRLVELGSTLGAGSLIGEIGLFSEDRKRTATAVCDTDCLCYTMTDEAIYLLYYQNPKLGFYLIRLIVQRLLQDLQRKPAAATI